MKHGPLNLDEKYDAHSLDPKITPSHQKGPGVVPNPDPGPALMTGAVGLPKPKKVRRAVP